jgi:very-short-patch-repair endonuclease
MNCKWCDKELTNSQVYSYLRGKSKGNSCSAKCAMLILNYGTIDNYMKPIANPTKYIKNCIVCNNEFISTVKNQKICSLKCSGKVSSVRMKLNNPMFIEEYRLKASNTLKKIKHKPLIQGGNGRAATVQQLKLYNELIKYDNSFEMELIEITGIYAKQFKAPTHYKIDIASRIHKLAIEVDGNSHNSLKVKECDSRKDQFLTFKGWKVLRLLNSQIDNELTNCVQTVLSTI